MPLALDCLSSHVGELLEEIQKDMFERENIKRDTCIVKAENWDEFMQSLNNKMMVLVLWYDEVDVEEDMKAKTKGEMGAAKTLCMPFDQTELPEGSKIQICVDFRKCFHLLYFFNVATKGSHFEAIVEA